MINTGTASHWERVKALYFERRDSLMAVNYSQDEELRFGLKGEHWRERGERYGMAERIQPVGRELKQEIVHLTEQVAGAEIYLDVRPNDREADAYLASMAKQYMEWELNNPQKHYRRLRKRMVKFALAGRMWGLALDFDPQMGRYGEILPREVDGRRTGWPSNFYNPHDMKCPNWWETQRLHKDTVRTTSGWRNNRDPRPDGDILPGATQMGDQAFAVPWTPADQGQQAGDIVSVIRFWEKDFTTVLGESQYKTLKRDERYMACGYNDEDGCGWKSPRQHGMPFKLPAVEPGACPRCGGDLHRRDAEEEFPEYLVYPLGRLTIGSPYESKPYYDDEWPQKMRSFPCLMFTYDDYPWEIVGESYTSEMWSSQQMIEVIDRVGIEHMMQALPRMAVPEDRIKDYRGEEWYNGEDQGLLLFYPFGNPHGIEMLEAKGAPDAWGMMRETFASRFDRAKASNDIRLDAGRSRDIPVGTIQAMQEVQELPARGLTNDLKWLEAVFVGCWWDMARDRSTNPERRIGRLLGDDGQWQLALLRLDEQPGYDFTIMTENAFRRFAVEDAQRIQALAQLDPPTRKLMARAYGINIADLLEYEQDLLEWQQEQQAMQVRTQASLADQQSNRSFNDDLRRLQAGVSAGGPAGAAPAGRTNGTPARSPNGAPTNGALV